MHIRQATDVEIRIAQGRQPLNKRHRKRLYQFGSLGIGDVVEVDGEDIRDALRRNLVSWCNQRGWAVIQLPSGHFLID